MSKRILVTGGAGFVGSNLVRRLLEAGHSVRVLDNLSRGRREYLHGLDLEFVHGDITDPENCLDAFKDIDKVVHLAAFGSVVESVEDPVSNFHMNVQGTFNVLDMCRKVGIAKLVFSSTGGALIGNAVPPVSESSLPKPISPYGAGKLACEAYCHAFGESYGMQIICLRFANVYGPNSEHKSGVVNKFAQRVMQSKPLTIFGDGSSTRDYIHVSDLCQGITLALANDTLQNEVIHIATGVETSLSQLAGIFLEIGAMESSMIDYLPSRVGEVERNFARFDHAHKLLGYSPAVSLRDGLADTYEYLREAYSS